MLLYWCDEPCFLVIDQRSLDWWFCVCVCVCCGGGGSNIHLELRARHYRKNLSWVGDYVNVSIQSQVQPTVSSQNKSMHIILWKPNLKEGMHFLMLLEGWVCYHKYKILHMGAVWYKRWQSSKVFFIYCGEGLEAGSSLRKAASQCNGLRLKNSYLNLH